MEQSNDNTEVRNIPKSLGGIEKPNSSIIHTSEYQTGMAYLVKAKYDIEKLNYQNDNHYTIHIFCCRIFHSYDEIEEWKNRQLSEVYPVISLNSAHYPVRDNGTIKKLAAYAILEINCAGKMEVLTIEVVDNESAKYWLSVMNGLKNRDYKDILIICADDLKEIRDAIQIAFPKTEYHHRIVHQISNTLEHVADKDVRTFTKDLKTIFNTPNEDHGPD